MLWRLLWKEEEKVLGRIKVRGVAMNLGDSVFRSDQHMNPFLQMRRKAMGTPSMSPNVETYGETYGRRVSKPVSLEPQYNTLSVYVILFFI